jgi:hypothetical protein
MAGAHRAGKAPQGICRTPLTIAACLFTCAGMKEITYVRLDPDVKRVAEQAAKADRRSLSAFIAKLVAEWADANGMIDRTVEESR